MNEERRKELKRIRDVLDTLQSDIEHVVDAEQESFDNLPESMQEGEKGQKMEGAMEAMNEAKGQLEEAIDYLDTAAE